MNWSHAAKSLAMFALSIVFLVLLTLFESVLSALSLTAERIVSGFFLVLPGVIGVIFAVLSLVRKEKRPWLAIVGLLMNLLFSLFNLSVVSFAG